jgi:Mg-chelatase subunit ChlI
MNIEEIKRLAEAATPGPWVLDELLADFYGFEVRTSTDEDEKVCADASEQDAAYIAAANPAAVLELIRQRDELMEALKDAREMVDDWGSYASAYLQEKHDIEGDLSRLDAVISKMETP